MRGVLRRAIGNLLAITMAARTRKSRHSPLVPAQASPRGPPEISGERNQA